MSSSAPDRHALAPIGSGRPATDLPAIQALARPDMAAVDALIRDRLASDVVLINQVAEYIIGAGGKSWLLKDSITSLAGRLDPATHLRIHRSTIVNHKRVEGLRRRGPKAMSLTLDTGADYAIGPNFVDSVLKVVNARRWR